MKKNSLFLFALFISSFLFSQEKALVEKDLFEQLGGTKAKPGKFSLSIQTRSGFDADFGGVQFQHSKFKIHELRINLTGNITDRLSYHWRQQLNRTNDHSPSIDNAPYSIDFAGIGYKFSDKISIFAGRQALAYGGIEFDLNPVDVYAYSAAWDGLPFFMTGLTVIYNINQEHELKLQALNSINGNGHSHSAKLPLIYSINWNANLLNGSYKPRWSASIMPQNGNQNTYLFALGNDFQLSKQTNFYVDAMYSKLATAEKRVFGSKTASDIDNITFISRVNHRIMPKINLFAKGIFQMVSLSSDKNADLAKGRFANTYGYQCGVEYYPMIENFRFYLAYMGKTDSYANSKRDLFFDNQISVGFIYKVPVFNP